MKSVIYSLDVKSISPQSFRLILSQVSSISVITFEPDQRVSYKTSGASSENSNQPAHPRSLIRVYGVCLKMLWIRRYPRSALQKL